MPVDPAQSDDKTDEFAAGAIAPHVGSEAEGGRFEREEMTQAKLGTLLVLVPLSPSEIKSLEAAFPRVIHVASTPFAPQLQDGERWPTEDEFAEADAMLLFTIPANLKSVKQTPNLKWIQAFSAGTDHLVTTDFYKSLDEAKSDVIVSNASGIHVRTIPEHVIGTVITLLHKLHLLTLIQHNEQRWAPAQTEFGGRFIREICTLKFGIIGYGHIGRETARLAKCFGASVVALTRSGKRDPEKGYIIEGTGDLDGSIPERFYSSEDAKQVDEFMNVCDVVVMTLPSTKATKGFMSERQFKAMKGNAIFVNIGRGDTVVTEDLMKALKADKSGNEAEDATGSLKIGGACLDVTDPEPLPNGHPLFSYKNVVITPHSSGISIYYNKRAVDLAITNGKRISAGKGALNAVRGKGEDD